MLVFIALFVCALVSGSEAGGWKLVWQDEFNGNSLNTGEWKFETGGGGWGNHELEYYTNHHQNARVENGHLVINARVEDHGGMHFTSARLSSKKAWNNGKFECRAMFPRGKNLWPAIWLFPQGNPYGTWAASGEIDIMESRGEKTHIGQGTIHYGGSIPNNKMSGSGEKTFSDFSAAFHVFSVEWDPKEIRWYVDGKKYHTENINHNMWSGKGKNPYNHNSAPFDTPFHWILNVAVGGAFFPSNVYGHPVTPAEAKHWAKPTMEIDYVRVYQWK